MVKVTAERLPDAQVVLNIEVEPEKVEKATERAYQSLAGRVRIPGFRPGKAPRYLVERYVGGPDVLKQEGIERVIPEAYREALQQADVRPIDQPEFEVVSTEPFVLKATVSVEPKVELGDYKAVRVPRIPVDVPYERINETIEQLRERQTEWTPVERGAQPGDRLTADVVGTVGVAPTLYDASGQPILQTEGGEKIIDSQNAEVELNPENTAPVPGFHEQLVGVRPKSGKRFLLSLPADWPNEEQRSKSVMFNVTVHEVKEPKVPALDDEFARAVGSEYETLDALREDVRDRLRRQLEHEAEHQYEDAVLRELIAFSRIELPPALIKRETDRLLQNFERTLARQRLALDQYLRLTDKSADGLREELRPQAEANLRSYLVVREVGQAEGVKVAPEEVEAEIVGATQGMTEADARQARQTLERPEQREDIEASLWHRKVVKLLTDIAEGPPPTEPAEAGQPSASQPEATATETPSAEGAAEPAPGGAVEEPAAKSGQEASAEVEEPKAHPGETAEGATETG
ncbi:MAG TPA: trigger factor [Chloroflexota bacterium]|jgi:trigger factor